ncbi:hypothetical protein G9A89_009342 [Geosiphon pyriformis]|nr:hypothetical protein G9A89_009342 [Geosiphon pyriformis]
MPAKQKDIVRWHKDSRNMISVITETKLKSSIRPWIMNKFNGIQIFTFGLDKSFFSAGVTVVMNNFLACHISKVEEIPSCVVSICLLFKDKISVSIVGLYVGTSPGTKFGLALKVNFLIAQIVNSSTFVVLDGNFNEDGSRKSASLGFCSDLSLVNSFGDHFLASTPTWSNSRGVDKVIDYIFVSKSLISAVASHKVGFVAEFFNTDHNAVSISVGLKGLLDIHLNSVHKQANKNHWKFKLKGVNDGRWEHFRRCSSGKFLAKAEEFYGAECSSNLDAMWEIFRKTRKCLAPDALPNHWHKQYASLDYVNNEVFSRVISDINMCKLMCVVKNLPDRKAAGLSGIPNEL